MSKHPLSALGRALQSAVVGSALVLAAVPGANAATYDVSARFYDGGIQGQTLFNGSFDWNGTTVSNFHGLLSTSMWAWDGSLGTFKNKKGGTMPTTYLDLVNNCTSSGCTGYANGDPAWLNLGYQLAADYSDPSYVTVTTFRINSTDAVAGGGYDVWGTDPVTDPNNVTAFGYNDQNARNNNAFFTLVFDRNDPTNTSVTFDDIVYADMTRFGMMGPMVTGWKGMTGHIDHGAGAGSMGGYPTSLVITAVPEPETYAMFLAGLGMIGFIARRRRASQAAYSRTVAPSAHPFF